MTGRLQGKAAFVTGGGAGIGRAISLALAAEGAVVAVADIDGSTARACATAASNLPDGGSGIAYECDVSDRKAVATAMSTFVAETGRLDVLVNNAVMFHYAPLTEMPEDVVRRMLEVGIGGTLWTLQAGTPHLIASGGGSIINMSSVAVSFSIKNAAVYTSIKGAIDAPAAVYLASDDAMTITGVTLKIDGGITVAGP